MIAKQVYIGVDPGKSGAIAAIYGADVMICRLTDTLHDQVAFIEQFAESQCYALLEKVHAMPKQGVSSTFKFGASYGNCEMLLAAMKIPHDHITPQKWQKEMACMSKGDKNVTKRRAQEIFPQVKIIHATADAILLAELCRRQSMPMAKAA